MSESIRQSSFFHLPAIPPSKRINGDSWENLIAHLHLKQFFEELRKQNIIEANENTTNAFCQGFVQKFFANLEKTDHATKKVSFFTDKNLSIHLIRMWDSKDFGQGFALGFFIEDEKGKPINYEPIEEIYSTIALDKTYLYPIDMPEITKENFPTIF